MPIQHSEFVADVAIVYASDQVGGYGSGRLIAPGYILTARHVIVGPSAGNLSPQSVWNVLLLGEVKQGGEWDKPHHAEVAWLGKSDLDLALLRLLPGTKEGKSLTPFLNPQFALYDQVTSLGEVYATGFPEAWRMGNKTRDFSVPGSLWIPTRDGPYGWLVATSPDERAGWKGMSGASVCHVDTDGKLYLFGAVQQIPANFSHGQLDVARLSTAFEDPEFRNELETAIRAVPQIRPFHSTGERADTVQLLGNRARTHFPALTDGVTGNRLASLEAFLSEYLLRPSAPLKFLGRMKERKELDKWVRDANSHGYLAIVAPAGRGKSALVAEWAAHVADSSEFAVAFVPISIRFGVTRGDELAKLWLQRLQIIANENAVLSGSPDMWIDEIQRHLTSDRSTSEPALLVIVDGLDEATEAGWFRFPPRLGQGVKVLVTSRILAGEIDAEDALQRIGLGVTTPNMLLPPLSQKDLTEVDEVLERRIPGAAERLWKLTSGDPLLVRLYLEWFSQYADEPQQMPEVDPNSQESGLARYMRMWWDQIERGSGSAISGEVKEFLYLLACAYGPLTTEDVANLASIDPLGITTARGALSRILIGDGKAMGYAFSHPRIGQFFAEELMTKAHRAATERRLLEYCLVTLRRIGSQEIPSRDVSRYVLLFCVDHFRRGSLPIEDYIGLVGQGWMLSRRTLDGHYAGYIADLRRVREDAQRASDLRVQVRCALAIATVVSLSDIVPATLLKIAVDEEIVTGSQAIEMVREIVDPWSRAVSIASLALSISQIDALKALEVANQLRSEEIRLLALAGLAEHLPLSAQEEVAAELSDIIDDGSPIAALLARTFLKKTNGLVSAHMNKEEIASLDASLSQRIWSDIDTYIHLVDEIVKVLHASDQEAFVRVVAHATMHRDYKWKEVDHAQRLIRAVADYAPVDAITKLKNLLAESAEPGGEGELRLLARLAVLGEPGPFTSALAQLDRRTPWAAAAGLPGMDEQTRRQWAEACVTEAESNRQWQEHWTDVAKCLPYCSPSRRLAFVRDAWDSCRHISDSEKLTRFGAAVLPLVASHRRAALADRYADKLKLRSPSNWRTIAKIGLEVSEARLSSIRDALSHKDTALLTLSPRFPRQERNELLERVLDLAHVQIDMLETLPEYFEKVSNSEQIELASSFVDRITGKSSSWAFNRESGLLWAELIESLAPIATKALGESVVSRIEEIIPTISESANRALAFSTLALCASGSEAVRLAWAAFLEFADAGDGERHRLTDLEKIPQLLPEDPTIKFRSTGRKGKKARQLLKQLRDGSDRAQFHAMLEKQDFPGLERCWDEVTGPPVKSFRTLRELVEVATKLSLTAPSSAAALWTIGLDNTSGGGRPLLIEYLTCTLPLFTNLVSKDTLNMIADDVLDVTSWSWQ